MGVVYEAFDRERNERVALKKLARVDPLLIYQFKHEFRSLAEIVHPNLLPVYELIGEGDNWFLTMELLESPVNLVAHVCGESPEAQPATQLTETVRLDAPAVSDEGVPATVLRAGRPLRTGVDWDHLRSAFRQLAEGVTALHRENMLHRDLKPENVLVRPNGSVTVLDFGLVAGLSKRPEETGRASGDTSPARRVYQTSDGFVAGTVAYMSPEQAAAKDLTPASDWYAVGVMLFESLSGRLPFDGTAKGVLAAKQHREAPQPADFFSGIPEDLNALCRDLLRLDPRQRPAGTEILQRLGAVTPEGESPVADTPFVGRARQLAALYQAFGRAVAGRPAVCHVFGPSGSGKSALVGRMLSEIGQRSDILVLSSRCYEQESMPFKAVDGLMDALCLRLMQARWDVFASAPADLPALTRVFPVLSRAFVTSGAAEVPHFAGLRDLRGRAVAALGEMLTHLSERHMPVLAIDDLQWGDLDSISLLQGLFRVPGLRRVLFIASYRSENSEASPCLRALRDAAWLPATHAHIEIEVTPLSGEETRELALVLLGDSPASRAAADRIVQEARGSAFFVYELARHMRAGMDLEAGAKGGLDEILWRRASALPDEARTLLEAVAVAGGPIRLSDACAAAGIALPSHASLAQLRAGHFIRKFGIAVDDQVESYHDRVRESIASHLPGARRTQYHAGLAAAFEASGRAEPETIAGHCLAAGDPRAGCFFELAADRARERLAFNRAEEYFGKAAEMAALLPDRARLYEKRIHFYTDMARFGEAYALGRDAGAMLGVRLPAKFNLPALIADALMARLRVARLGIENILHLPEMADEKLRWVVRIVAAVAKAAYQVRPELCVAVSSKCVNLCLRKGNTGEASIAYMVYGCIFLGGVMGNYKLGHEFGRLALRLVEKYENRKQRAEVHFVVGYFGTSWLKPASEAERLWRIAYDAGLETNDLFHTGCACAGTVQSMYMRGAPLGQVWEESERMMTVLKRAQLREPAGCLESVRHSILALRGDSDPGYDEEAAAQEAARFGSRHFAHFYFLNRMQVLYLRDDLAGAKLAAAQSARYQSDSRGMLHSAEHVFYSGLIAAAAGNRGETSRARKAFARWAALCPHNFEHKFHLLAAEKARLGGRTEEAARLYTAAAQSAEKYGYLQVHALAHRLAERLHAVRGEHSAATQAALLARQAWARWGAAALVSEP